MATRMKTVKDITGEVKDVYVITTDGNVSEVNILTTDGAYSIKPGPGYASALTVAKDGPVFRDAWEVTAIDTQNDSGRLTKSYFEERDADKQVEKLKREGFEKVTKTKINVEVDPDDEDKPLDDEIPF